MGVGTPEVEPRTSPSLSFDDWVRSSDPGLQRALVARYGVDVGPDLHAEALAYAWEHWDRLSTMTNPIGCSHSKLRSRSSAVDSASTTEGPMAAEPLIAAEAARRLDLSTKDLLRLIYERRIRYVMVDGIAHIPEDALDEYRRHAAS